MSPRTAERLGRPRGVFEIAAALRVLHRGGPIACDGGRPSSSLRTSFRQAERRFE